MRLGKAVYIEVAAGVRYWEDASVNGEEDELGDKIPFRDGDTWRPIIQLSDGFIVGWPDGISADIHYKVCDDGEYWLLDITKSRIAKWNGHYVPGDILCVNSNGYGDYIIMQVGQDGFIAGWQKPELRYDQWVAS